MVDADFGLFEGVPIGSLEGEGGAELFGPPCRIPFDLELVHGHRHLVVAAAVKQIQLPAGGEELFLAVARQGAPGGSHHQHHQARMDQQGAHPAGHAAPCRQAIGLDLEGPALAFEQLLQVAQTGGRIGAGEGFRQGELAQLARRLVVNPAQGGL